MAPRRKEDGRVQRHRATLLESNRNHHVHSAGMDQSLADSRKLLTTYSPSCPLPSRPERGFPGPLSRSLDTFRADRFVGDDTRARRGGPQRHLSAALMPAILGRVPGIKIPLCREGSFLFSTAKSTLRQFLVLCAVRRFCEPSRFGLLTSWTHQSA